MSWVDLVLLACPALACVALVPATLAGLIGPGALALHGSLFAAFALGLALLGRRPVAGGRWRVGKDARAALHLGLVCALAWTLYSTLGPVALDAVPWRADAALARLDAALFGDAPQRLAAAWTSTRAGTELLSFAYAAFLPYLMLSVARAACDGSTTAGVRLRIGLSLVYAVGLALYVLVPAEGPIATLAHTYPSPIDGGALHRLVVASVASAGGPHGAFPSLHVAVSVLLCLHDARSGRAVRAGVGALLVAGIAFATVALRYHYVVDLVSGAALAVVAFVAAGRLVPDPASRSEGHPRPATAPGPAYRLVRAVLGAALRGFYRPVAVVGPVPVPVDGPLLIVANHVNGLVDPLPVVCSTPRRVTLVAKAALRSSPAHRLLLRLFGAVTVERATDVVRGDPEGRRNHARHVRNDAALVALRDELSTGGAVLMFPEGRSHPDGRGRPFHRGAARLALSAAAAVPAGSEVGASAAGTGLTVLPVHLDYEAGARWRSGCTVRTGEPLDVARWALEHASHAGAMPDWLLTAELERRVRALAGERSGDGAGRVPGDAREPERPTRSPSLRRVRTALARLESVLAAPLALWGALHAALPFAAVAALHRWPRLDEDHRAAAAILAAPPVAAFGLLGVTAGAFAVLPPAFAALYALSVAVGAGCALEAAHRLASR